MAIISCNHQPDLSGMWIPDSYIRNCEALENVRTYPNQKGLYLVVHPSWQVDYNLK